MATDSDHRSPGLSTARAHDAGTTDFGASSRCRMPHHGEVGLRLYAASLMSIALQAAADEYLSWLQLEANKSPNTVRAYGGEIRRFAGFLAARGHTLQMDEVTSDDLRAYSRSLASNGLRPATRARALVALRAWLRWLAREEMVPRDLSNRITLPKLEQRLPKPLPADELARLLAGLPSGTMLEKRDRALINFLISTGCRISEVLTLDRADVPRSGSRLVVTGKGNKQRAVYLTDDARRALDEYLDAREDTSLALFVNYDRRSGGHGARPEARRLTANGARHIVNKLRVSLGAWSFRSPHVARHTTATTLLEVTGGDVRLVQEVLGHANLNTLQGYTKIVDARKEEAYEAYQAFLETRRKKAVEQGDQEPV